MKEYETDPIYMEALEWFVLMKDEKAGAQDRLAFEHWLKEDHAHAEAFERAQALWDRFDIVIPEYTRLKQKNRIGRRGVVLGGLALLIGGPALYAAMRPDLFADYKTGIAERRRFILPDGSSAELGGYSAISLDFTTSERRLTLHRGQAFFQVAADRARPFIVAAANGTATALGTAFDVKLVRDHVTVSVTEHAVEVRSGEAAPVTVDTGWQISYDAESMQPVEQADMVAVQAWRRDRLIFADVPFRQVVAELERYRRGQIILMDNSIGDMPVTAIFDTAQIETVLPIIAETMPVRILNANGYITLIYRR